MALRTETKQIGEHTYDVTQLAAIPARTAFLRLTKLVAPALAELAADGQKDAKEKGLRAIAKAVENLTSEDLDYFVTVFAPSTCIVKTDPETGKVLRPKLSQTIAIHFEGDALADLFEWLVFCFEVNYSSFFGRLGARLGTSGVRATESK